MTHIAMLTNELEQEVKTTRRLVERLPADRLAWQPHAKSFTAGALAAHLVDCLRWVEPIASGDELELDPATYRAFSATSLAELLDAFDAESAKGCLALARLPDALVMQPWRLIVLGRVQMERTKAEALRDLTLSHLIHHRGQLSVYLRLLEVPVPGAYGPTADEDEAA